MALARAAAAAAAVGAAAAQRTAVVDTSAGPVEGAAADAAGACAAFYGVPYAAPPTGDLRFRPPRPPAAWTATRPAHKVGRSCMQTFADGGVVMPMWAEKLLEALGRATGSVPMEPMGEDCLFLNVFSPRLGASGAGLPVMVWFHGGSWLGGSGDLQSGIPFYDGRRLCAAEDVVVVTVNYRLGVFGFYASDELLAEGGTAGNMGLQDQRAALEWVRDNARVFGGDPGRVTIFGESAGGGSVAAHLAFPRSAPLFSAAVMQSGGMWDMTLATAARAGAPVAAAAGCPGGSLACLRGAGALDLLHAQMQAGYQMPGPVADGYEMPRNDSLRAIFASGRFAPRPVLAGTNLNETALFLCLNTPKDLNQTGMRSHLAGQLTPSGLDAVVDLYDASRHYGGSWRRAYIDVSTDQQFFCDTRDILDAVTAAGQPAYKYLLERTTRFFALDPCLGVPHMTDLFYLFLNFGELLDEGERALASRMASHWGSFARNHTPAAGWPGYGAGRRYLRLDAPADSAAAGWKDAQCDALAAARR